MANTHDHIPHINKRDIRFASSDGTSSIHGFIWKPLLQDDTQPRALVQLVHGISEHSGRYEAFATFLVDAGFAVCANDHIGHGGSVSGDGYGYLPPDKGVDIMLEDVDRMRQLAQEDVGTSYTLMKLGCIAMSAKTARHVPRTLPVLFIAGAEDPVGSNGTDVGRAERRLHKAGVENVGLILYGEMRHEILNETGRALVYADVLSWFKEQLLQEHATLRAHPAPQI